MAKGFSMNWAVVLLLAALLLMAGCLHREGGASPPLVESANLQAFLSAPDEVLLCDKIPLEFTVTNQGETALYLLKWYTPLEGVAGKIFRVSYQGQELDYLGILAMRGDPTPDQYVILEPGESAAAKVDLSPYFDFGQPGEYQIAYLSPWISYVGAVPADLPDSVDELRPVKIPAEPIILEVLASENSEDCVPGKGEEAYLPDPEPDLVVTGLVRDVSPSLKMIWLDEEQGIHAIALTDDTVLMGEEGQPLELIDTQPGMKVEAAGRPGVEGVVIADQVIIFP